ncbi:Uncharacterised protein [Mycobacteroides abscessus subsp. abscessus]|nr:Uncharacterised protein [Mycobacteroides abscessus subsp. abscessus]
MLIDAKEFLLGVLGDDAGGAYPKEMHCFRLLDGFDSFGKLFCAQQIGSFPDCLDAVARHFLNDGML